MAIYKGAAKKLDDIDLPRIGAEVGVGEDPIHALIEVETLGTGFDKHGRVIMLFEPHKFYANLRGDKRSLAVEQGLAYKNWGTQPYPRDSYPRLDKAIAINETAALKSCSWGMGQVLGDNHEMLNYDSVQDMVKAFADDEEAQLQGMIDFIKGANIDDDLRRIEEKIKQGHKVTAADWVPIVRVYNGPKYAKNNYHNRAATALNKWLRIKDTPFGKSLDLKVSAGQEEAENVTPEVQDDTIETPVTDTAALQPPVQPTQAAAEAKEEPVTVQSVAQSLGSKVMAGGVPTGGVLTAIGLALTGALKNPYVIGGIIIAVLAIGAYLWDRSKERQSRLQSKLIDKAADRQTNTVAVVPPATTAE